MHIRIISMIRTRIRRPVVVVDSVESVELVQEAALPSIRTMLLAPETTGSTSFERPRHTHLGSCY